MKCTSLTSFHLPRRQMEFVKNVKTLLIREFLLSQEELVIEERFLDRHLKTPQRFANFLQYKIQLVEYACAMICPPKRNADH